MYVNKFYYCQQDREGAYSDYQDASALKYSHVQATARYERRFTSVYVFVHLIFSFIYFLLLEILSEKIRKRMVYGVF